MRMGIKERMKLVVNRNHEWDVCIWKKQEDEVEEMDVEAKK